MQAKFIQAGVIGWPVAHSRSPLIHNYWIRQHKLNGAYGLFPVEPKSLETAIRGLKALGIAGCNITIPHKIAAMTYVDKVDPQAQRIGAINTIVIDADGALVGFNHDGFGYIQSLYDAQPTWKADAGPIAVLGAGGACRAIIVALIDAGAKEIRITNRSIDKAEALAQEFAGVVSAIDWSERNNAISGCALLVNTTSLGMHGQEPLEINLDQLPTNALVSDAVYVPLETQLLQQARIRGNTTVNGLGMLLHQARPAFHSWFGIMPEVTQELRQNIISTF